MAKTKALEIIYEISEILYRNGKYGMERVAIICEIIGKLMQSIGWDTNLKFNRDYFEKVLDKIKYELKTNSYLQDKDEKQLLELFTYLIEENKQDIANSIKQLVENDRKTSGLIATDDFSVKVMQTFAKKMYKGGVYIDPCIGTGRLLAGLGADNYYGFDIDRNAMKISETYLNLIENSPNRTRLNIKLSTENFLYRSFGLMDNIYNPTYIFDPPLNNLIEMNPMLQEYLYRNGIYSNGNKIPSEYAFLTQVLFGTHINECCYICIFTNNFLFAQDKFKTSFRKYLFENSLIAVIQSNFSETTGIQKLILVGKSRLENSQDNLRYFITFKDKDISEQNISRIAQKCLNNETFDEKEFYDVAKIQAYTLEEIKGNDYQISMPQYYENEINPNEIKSLSEIVEYLKESNEKLDVKSLKLEKILQNLLEGHKSYLEIKQLDTNIQKRTNKGKKWYEIEDSEEAKAINTIMINTLKKNEIAKYKYQISFRTYTALIPQLLEPIKTAIKYERITVINGKFYINTKKTIEPTERHKTNFINLIFEFNANKLETLSKKQEDLYKLLINYYLDFKYIDSSNTDDTSLLDLLNKYSESELYTSLCSLKTLGLIQENENHIKHKDNLNIKDIDILSEIYQPFKGLIYADYDFREYI